MDTTFDDTTQAGGDTTSGDIETTGTPTSDQAPQPQGGSQQGDDDATGSTGAANLDAPIDFARLFKEALTESKDFSTAITLEKHELSLDNTLFLFLLAGSVSISIEDKKSIVNRVPGLSQFQADELIKIFLEEKEKFNRIALNDSEEVSRLREAAKRDWNMYEEEVMETLKKENEQSKAEELRKKLGLST